MKTLIKNIVSFGLLFCFLTTIFHFHHHSHSHEISNKQVLDKKNDTSHHSSNDCEECLTKNNKFELQFFSEKLFNNFLTISKHKSPNFTNYSTYIHIFSRPPPATIS